MLCDKLDEIGKNVQELKNEEEFVNLYKGAGRMLKRSKVMHHEIKSLTDEFQKFFDDHCKMGKETMVHGYNNIFCLDVKNT